MLKRLSFCGARQFSRILKTNTISRTSLVSVRHHSYPRVTERAPNFKATAYCGGEFKDISLEDYKGKWVLLFFYPLDFTFVCPTEITQFSDQADAFRSHNCEVIGCSIDSEHVHKAWSKTPRNEGGLGELDIPLLADMKKEIMTSYGAHLDTGFSCRATFIIDPNQVIRHMTFSENNIGRSVPEYLRLLQASQFADNNPGMVCPVNWNPKKKALQKAKADEYFAEHATNKN